MKSSRVFVLLLLLVQVFLITEVCGLSLSISGGDCSGTVGSTTKISAPTDASVESVAILTAGSLSHSIRGTGDLGAQTHEVSNRDGSKAAVYVEVDNAASYQYGYSLYPGEGSGYSSKYVKASESLSATNADKISAGANANNAENDLSEVSVLIQHGTLKGYKNSAYADKTRTKASQSANSASGDSIEIYQHASNDAGYDVYSQGSINKGAFNSYSGSADAKKTAVSMSQSFGSITGDVISSDAEAINIVGGVNAIDGQEVSYIENGALNSFTSSADAKKNSVTSSLYFKSASGQRVSTSGNANNIGLDGDAFASLDTYSANIKKYSASVSANMGTTLGATSSQSLNSAKADSISIGSGARNSLGRVDNSLGWVGAETITKITSGSLSKYSDNSYADGKNTKVSSDINAKGSKIDVYSLAINARDAYEPVSYTNGNVVIYSVPQGAAVFEFQTSNDLNAKIKSNANSNDVVITPTLPKNTPTAIMLEPMFSVFVGICGGTNLGTTAFPSMVQKGYATLRYVDSGATKAKFNNLDHYNIALIDSHMNDEVIALSTGPGASSFSSYISYDELKYKKPPSKSLVILGGCESFMPNWDGTPSDLEKAVSKANLRGGYATLVYTNWNEDYLGQIFVNMAKGMTFSQAESYAWNNYRLAWCSYYGVSPDDQYLARLLTYGNSNFAL
jgi:hypothetical protein